jgi:hypothetical protein
MSIEAMKQVKQDLEHIKQYGYATDIEHAIKTLGHAIEEAEKQEPFAPDWVNYRQGLIDRAAQREWVELTEEEIEKIVNLNTSDDAGYDIFCDGRGVARAVIDKLKEKNA